MTDYEWVIADGAGDVRLTPIERRDVYGSPLFLCPQAVSATVNLGVNAIDKLVAGAQEAGVVPPGDRLGRQAIAHVVGCRPTLYRKLLDTCNVINWNAVTKLNKPPPISGEDIIVCGFRLRDFSKIKTVLGFTDETIAAQSGVPLALVKSLAANYRLHLAPVLKIYELLHKAALDRPFAEGDPEELVLLRSGAVRRSIIIDRKPYANIQRMGKSDAGNDIYRLDQDNIEPAPRTGHPWAVDGEDLDAAVVSAGAADD